MTHPHPAAPAASLLDAFPGTDPGTLPVTDHVPEQIRLSRRELALIFERLIMAAGCPSGAWPGARDYALETVSVLGPDALDVFEHALVRREGAAWPLVTPEGADTVDASGAPMILVGNTIANALLAYFADTPDGTFTVTGLSDVRGHEGLIVRAAYHGFALRFAPDQESGALAITATRTTADTASEVVTLLRGGVACSGAQWWRLYQPSNFALSEETELSRSHTGVSETLLHYAV
ncbi:hypothetical protein [Leucobacter chromiireducens]|uniref:Uncharacterized protein n=1 Tax=Leucobacter chromiireducens subsp. solipictus TaxID=398235 RepID=A0ABS1SKH5_9MICO|nr:hypothetical protein [Leucobacter chromiireducens]MBL3680507.1 hypothetical protein [Leucobacter chromiireducens subsp. solipictus]